MAQKESFAQIKLRKAPVAGIVLEGMMADDASVGVAHAGQKSSLLGEGTAGVRPKMIGAPEVVAATQEVLATVDHELLGQQLWLQSSFELRGSQSPVTRCAELLFLGKL